MLWLVLIGAMAFALRFWQLSAAPIWMDEAYTYLASQLPLRTILFGAIDFHPPLYYAIQHVWMLFDPSLAALRVPAAFLGGLAVIVVALATADLASRRAGLAAGAFLALSTGHVYFSQDARMYPQLTLGLALAVWGLVGLADGRLRRWRYAALYLAGASIAVYSQAIALAFLFAVNACACAVIAARPGARPLLIRVVLANFVLGIISLPQLYCFRESAGTFRGMRAHTIGEVPWFLENMVGFPGLPHPVGKIVTCLLLAFVCAGTAAAWRTRLRLFAVVSFGGLALYPLVILAANHLAPMIENRIFIPCTLCLAILFGVSASLVRMPALRILAVAAATALLAISTVREHQVRTKPEDDRAALALADRYGFQQAPILTCQGPPGTTAYLSAPGRQVFFMIGESPEPMDGRFSRAIGMGIVERYHADARRLESVLGVPEGATGALAILAAARKVIVLDAGCNSTDREVSLLRRLGFEQIANPPIRVGDAPVVFQSLWTQLRLWQRPPNPAGS